MMYALKKAPNMAPSGKAEKSAAAMVPRRRFGENSAAMAMKQGVAPPRPSPAKNR